MNLVLVPCTKVLYAAKNALPFNCLLFDFTFYSVLKMLNVHAGNLQFTPICRVAFCYRQQPTTNPSCQQPTSQQSGRCPKNVGTVLTPSVTATVATSKTYRNTLCKNKNAFLLCSHFINELSTRPVTSMHHIFL